MKTQKTVDNLASDNGVTGELGITLSTEMHLHCDYVGILLLQARVF